eukprot:1183632-Prorocentrum_minimum.AAC.2
MVDDGRVELNLAGFEHEDLAGGATGADDVVQEGLAVLRLGSLGGGGGLLGLDLVLDRSLGLGLGLRGHLLLALLELLLLLRDLDVLGVRLWPLLLGSVLRDGGGDGVGVGGDARGALERVHDCVHRPGGGGLGEVRIHRVRGEVVRLLEFLLGFRLRRTRTPASIPTSYVWPVSKIEGLKIRKFLEPADPAPRTTYAVQTKAPMRIYVFITTTEAQRQRRQDELLQPLQEPKARRSQRVQIVRAKRPLTALSLIHISEPTRRS